MVKVKVLHSAPFYNTPADCIEHICDMYVVGVRTGVKAESYPALSPCHNTLLTAVTPFHAALHFHCGAASDKAGLRWRCGQEKPTLSCLFPGQSSCNGREQQSGREETPESGFNSPTSLPASYIRATHKCSLIPLEGISLVPPARPGPALPCSPALPLVPTPEVGRAAAVPRRCCPPPLPVRRAPLTNRCRAQIMSGRGETRSVARPGSERLCGVVSPRPLSI